MDAWLAASSKTEVGLGYWRTPSRALFCAEASEISLLHFRIDLLPVRGHACPARRHQRRLQESRLEGGSQRARVAARRRS